MTPSGGQPPADVATRVDELLRRLSLEDKAALMFQPIATIGPLDVAGIPGLPSVREMLARGIRHFNIHAGGSTAALVEWHNAVQREALAAGLGIPVTIGSDPRHSFTDNPMISLPAGPFSAWPEPIGFAAIGDEALAERFADIVRQEYLAVGIRTALHPQLDLATEPRWARQVMTFGEDAALAGRLGAAYIRGLQGRDFGSTSVSAMIKHFPGGGPQKDGEDPHFSYGKHQVYPGRNWDYHLEPFRMAIAAGARQVMPYYAIPLGTDWEEVGFGFNRDVVTDLLRGELGFAGIVCSDWGILTLMPWGVEGDPVEARMRKSLDAGVDQWGGDCLPEVLVGLVRDGLVAESRIDASVRRLLAEKVLLGLFDAPFVDGGAAAAVVGNAAFRAEGLAAQAAAHVLLKNDRGPAHLPLAPGLRVYAEGLTSEDLGGRAIVVASPDDADVAVLLLATPYETGVPEGPFPGLHAGSLAFPAAELARIRAITGRVPTVVVLYLERPAIVAGLLGDVAALIANFGASPSAVVSVLFGEAEPRGRLPFDAPSSMAAVLAARSDVPFDTASPTFRAGFGLRYEPT
jgi:beta-glucosidase